MYTEDERQSITKESIRSELKIKYKYPLIHKTLLLIIYGILAIIIVINFNKVVFKIICFLPLLIMISLVVYDFVFYFCVIKNKRFSIIEDTLVSIDHDVLAFSKKEFGYDSPLKHKLVFKKSGIIFISHKRDNLTEGDNFYLVIPDCANKKALVLYNTKSYIYKEH